MSKVNIVKPNVLFSSVFIPTFSIGRFNLLSAENPRNQRTIKTIEAGHEENQGTLGCSV